MKALLEEHVPRVYRFALRLTGNRQDAEDLAQETFVRAWRHRRRLRDRSSVRVWLFAIAANLWRDWLRRRKRRPQVVEVIRDEQRGPAAPPDQEAVVREDVRRVVEARDRLPPRQREVLYLHAWEQLSSAEIAEILGISAEAVKASLSLARRRMREWFEKDARSCSSCRASSSDEQV